MNERIRELALQANIKYSTRDDDFYSAAFDGVHRPDMERFAELLVRECIDAAEQAQADFYVINNIKTRFGVEE